MPKHSKPNWTGSATRFLLVMLSAAFLTGCSNLSDMVKEAAKKKEAQPAPKVAVSVNPPAVAKLPDMPDSLRRCLNAKAAKAADKASADDTVKALYAADRTKADCAKRLFAWYRDRQKEAAGPDKVAEGHPRTVEKKTPSATW